MGDAWSLDPYLDEDGFLTTDGVRRFIEDSNPEMGRLLRPFAIAVFVEDGPDDEGQAWIASQLADLEAMTGLEDILQQPNLSISPPTFTD